MDEDKKIIDNGEQGEHTPDYLDAIKGLKEQGEKLSKENEQLREDNKKLLNDFLNGGTPQDESTPSRTNEEIGHFN